MDIIEIEPDDINIDNINIPIFSDNEDDDLIIKPSSNFGSGIELLMNDKNKNEKKSSNIEENLWIIPEIRMKAKKEHKVPLSPQA